MQIGFRVAIYLLLFLEIICPRVSQAQENHSGTYVNLKTYEMLVLKQYGNSFHLYYSNGKSNFIELPISSFKRTFVHEGDSIYLFAKLPFENNESKFHIDTYEILNISVKTAGKEESYFDYFSSSIELTPTPLNCILSHNEGLFCESESKELLFLKIDKSEIICFYSNGINEFQKLNIVDIDSLKRDFTVRFINSSKLYQLHITLLPYDGGGFGTNFINCLNPDGTKQVFYKTETPEKIKPQMPIKEILAKCRDCKK